MPESDVRIMMRYTQVGPSVNTKTFPVESDGSQVRSTEADRRPGQPLSDPPV